MAIRQCPTMQLLPSWTKVVAPPPQSHQIPRHLHSHHIPSSKTLLPTAVTISHQLHSLKVERSGPPAPPRPHPRWQQTSQNCSRLVLSRLSLPAKFLLQALLQEKILTQYPHQVKTTYYKWGQLVLMLFSHPRTRQRVSSICL